MSQFNLNKALLAAGMAQETIDTIHSSDPDNVDVQLGLPAPYERWGVHVTSLPEGDGERYLAIHLYYQAYRHPVSKTKLTLLYDRQTRQVGTDFPLNVDRGEEVAVWHNTRAGVLTAVRKGTPRPGKPALELLKKMLAHLS